MKGKIRKTFLFWSIAASLLSSTTLAQDIVFGALTLDNTGQWDSGAVARILASVRGLLTVNEVSVTFLVSYLVVALLIMLFLLASRTRIKSSAGSSNPTLNELFTRHEDP